jgi:1-acyl-sn-glycerol-3-phosphate acyltransferase
MQIKHALRAARFVRIALEAVGNARMGRDQRIAARAGRLHHACAEIAASHGMRIEIAGCWPREPVVFVANQVSVLDIIAIAAVQPCVPIARSEVATWPVIGAAATGLGAIFVERDSVPSRARGLRRALVALRSGVSVLDFPDGLHRGSVGLARLANVPIVPIEIRCASELAWTGQTSFVRNYLRIAKLDPRIHLEVGYTIGRRTTRLP